MAKSYWLRMEIPNQDPLSPSWPEPRPTELSGGLADRTFVDHVQL